MDRLLRGGLGRNRTGSRGFAVRCITTLPPTHTGSGGAIGMPRVEGQAGRDRASFALLPATPYKSTQDVEADMTDFALARRNMIDGQLRPNRVTNAQLLAAVAEL